MAEPYSILSTVPDVELIPPNQTRSVRVVTAQAEPSGVTFSFSVVAADFAPSHINLIAHDIATAVNKAAEIPGVASIDQTEAINADLNRFPAWNVTVESTSGNATDEISVPYGALFDERFAQRVEKARANLDSIEQLPG
jgi:hypothetical protein